MTARIGEGLAVIFDVDGVLVDSYDAHRRSWQRLAGECGVAFTDEDFASTFGRTSREIIRAHWPGDAHTDEAVRELIAKAEERANNNNRRTLRPHDL